jgi:hypothetical protein
MDVNNAMNYLLNNPTEPKPVEADTKKVALMLGM